MPFKHLTVRHLMSKVVVTLSSHQSLSLAEQLMEEKRIRHLPVVDEDNVVVGLVSHRDVLAAHVNVSDTSGRQPGDVEFEIPVLKLMTERPLTVHPQTPAIDAAKLLVDKKIGCAPVVDEQGRLVGIITEADFLRLLQRLLHRRPEIAVSQIMTPDPVTLHDNQTLTIDTNLLSLRRLRHLPVVDGQGTLVGLVTHRDLLSLQTSTVTGTPVAPVTVRVEDLATQSVWSACPTATIAEVVQILTDHRFGCVPITESGKLVGIVTEADCLRFLIEDLLTTPTARAAELPVNYYMNEPIIRITTDHATSHASRLLDSTHASCLVVCDSDRAVGLIDQHDILDAAIRPHDHLLELGGGPVSGLVRGEPSTLAPSDSVRSACRRLLDEDARHLVVVSGDRPIGTFSRADALLVARDLRLAIPLDQVMSTVLFTVESTEEISRGLGLLEQTQLSGLVVCDQGWPVGVFGTEEALSGSRMSPDTKLEHALNPGILCLPTTVPLHRAAAQAAALGARMIVVHRGDRVAGVVTPTDFVRAVVEIA